MLAVLHPSTTQPVLPPAYLEELGSKGWGLSSRNLFGYENIPSLQANRAAILSEAFAKTSFAPDLD
jgi:hypothetical protein